LKQRLSCCALVSQTWKAAAAAATTDISLRFSYQPNTAAALAGWLNMHGAALTHIALEAAFGDSNNSSEARVLLPLQQLQHLRSPAVVGHDTRGINNRLLLEADYCPADSNFSSSTASCCSSCSQGGSISDRLNTSSSSSSSSAQLINPQVPFAACLASLQLHGVDLKGFSGGWRCLSAVKALRQLDLFLGQHERPDSSSAVAADGLGLGAALCQLTGLTQLQMEWQLDASVCAALGELQQLKELRLCDTHWRSNRLCLGAEARGKRCIKLPASLTRLELIDPREVSSSSMPGLSAVTALQQLHLEDICWLQPQFLSGLKQLRQLHLLQLELLLTSSWLSQLLSELLAMLPHLQQLQQLHIHNECSPMPETALEQCSMLACSLQLTSLQLIGIQLPLGCCRSLFSQPQLHLKSLELTHLPPKSSHNDISQPLDADGMACLAASCPELQQLTLQHVVPQGGDLAGLRQLTTLTSLTVQGSCISDACAEALGRLSSLRRLMLADAGWDVWAIMSVQGLMHLAQLTALTYFACDGSCSNFFGVGSHAHSIRELRAPVRGA
jgi:hypothetical protein